LATKDHFSSSWASWVEGGKGHEFVVALPGVGASPQGVADDGVFIDPREAGGLADAAAVLEVGEDGDGLGVRQAGAEQGGTFAFGEALLAGAAGEHPALGGAIAEADTEVPLATQAIVLTVRVLAAEQVKFVHATPQS
jgi:hypothetical protein